MIAPVENVGVVEIWRLQLIDDTVASGKTVRSPVVPSTKFGSAPRSWRPIFREIALTDCVVKRLAAATSLRFAPPALAMCRPSDRSSQYSSASPSSSSSSSESRGKRIALSRAPSEPRMPRVTTSR